MASFLSLFIFHCVSLYLGLSLYLPHSFLLSLSLCLCLCLCLSLSLFLPLSFLIPVSETKDHLLSDTLIGPDTDSPDRVSIQNNNLPTYPLRGPSGTPEPSLISTPLGILQPPPPPASGKSQLSLERSFSAEEDQQKCVQCALQPARVYTITGESGMLGSGRGSKESLELEVLKGAREATGPQTGGHHSHSLAQPSTSPSSSSTSSSPTQYHHRHGGAHHHGNSHHGNQSASSSSSTHASGTGNNGGGEGTSSGHHRRHHHHQLAQPPLSSSVSAHNIRGWGEGKESCKGSCGVLACESCGGVPSRSQGSLDLESSGREAGKQHRRLERMHSVDRMTGLERGEREREGGREMEKGRERGVGSEAQ